MNKEQASVVMRMIVDPRLPLELSETFSGAILASRGGADYFLTDEQLEGLSQYLPDLVSEYRDGMRRCEKVLNRMVY